MPKDSRLRRGYRKSASALHKAVGKILYNDTIFKFCKVYQEYPVNRISSYFDSGREKFDWVILDPYRAVLECHGEQHYKPVRFGGMTEEEAQANYEQQVIRDQKKRKAAEKAGYAYIVIKYNEEPTPAMIIQRINDYEPIFQIDKTITSQAPTQRRYQESKTRRDSWLESSGIKERSKEIRKEQYERAKRYRLNQKTSKTSK